MHLFRFLLYEIIILCYEWFICSLTFIPISYVCFSLKRRLCISGKVKGSLSQGYNFYVASCMFKIGRLHTALFFVGGGGGQLRVSHHLRFSDVLVTVVSLSGFVNCGYVSDCDN